MKKKKAWKTAPEKVHLEGPIVGRGCGLNYSAIRGAVLYTIFPDEMDDVQDWVKEAAKKIFGVPPRVKEKINKIFRSTEK